MGIVSFKKFTHYTAVHVSNTTRYLIDMICYRHETATSKAAGALQLPFRWAAASAFHLSNSCFTC